MSVLPALIVLLGIPVGLLLAWLARDELVQGRKWFIALIIVSSIAGIVLIILKKAAEAGTCFFIAVLALVAWRKSFDKRWVRRNI